MNRIDVVLATILALFALRGFWRGFSREFFSLVGLLGGIAVAGATYASAADLLPPAVPELGRPLVAFVGVFIAVALAAKLAGALVRHALGLVLLSTADRLAGALFGAVKGAALVGVALLVMRSYMPSSALERTFRDSTLMRPLLRLAGNGLEAAATARRLREPAAVPSAAGG